MRYDEFTARKTREAEAAILPPYTTVLDAHDDGVVSIGNEWTRARFDGDFFASPPSAFDRPACGIVFVQSRDGNTGATNPSSLGAGDTDKHLIYEGLSRVAADAVLAGAGTAREGTIIFSVWHPELVRLREALRKPRHPVQIVTTLRGLDMERGLLFNVPDVSVVLITVGECVRRMREALASRPWITPVLMETRRDLRGAFKSLSAMGIGRISAVGGRAIATQLIDAGLVQDVYLTTSPRSGGEPDTPMYPRALNATVIVRKHGTGAEAGVVFEHLKLVTGPLPTRSAPGDRERTPARLCQSSASHAGSYAKRYSLCEPNSFFHNAMGILLETMTWSPDHQALELENPMRLRSVAAYRGRRLASISRPEGLRWKAGPRGSRDCSVGSRARPPERRRTRALPRCAERRRERSRSSPDIGSWG